MGCLSIVIAKLDGATYSGNELPDVGEPGQDAIYTDYVELNTVTRVGVSKEAIYDEGDQRLIYWEHTVEIEAVVTDGDLMGPVTEPGGDPDALTFDEKLEEIYKFLGNQGLGINFGNYPVAIQRISPGNENRDAGGEYTGFHGWLIDNFNGPRPDSVQLIPLPGDEAKRLIWTVRYKTFHTDVEVSSDNPLIPKISSELRLDIDREGDLVIIVDGTIYADSLQGIYNARNWLELQYQPLDANNIKVYSRGSQISEDQWSMVNGFLKEVKFNIEKNGRSARFNITYTQVKSNNALPIGIRDCEFVQTIESNLFASDFKAGKGFRSWKSSFKGKVTIPPRLNAEYAWYVFHLLVQQQMRNTLMSFDSKAWDSEENVLVENENEVDPRMTVKKKYARALPVKLKIQHNHFARELSFEMDYVIICPIKYILAVSCILNRVNNDYQRRLNDTDRDYKPLKISNQWFNWNRSVDPSIGFDPTQPDSVNPTTSGRPHRDTAGTEILDTGHNYDPYKELDNQARQRNILVSTVFDPNEQDEFYEGIFENQSRDPGYEHPGGNFSDAFLKTQEEETPRKYGTPSWLNKWKGVMPFNPFFLLTDARGKTPDYDPKTTWLKYDQDYEIVEINQTIPTEGLADMDADYYKNLVLKASYANPNASNYTDDSMPPYQTGAKILGRESLAYKVSQSQNEANYRYREWERDEIGINDAAPQSEDDVDVVTQRKTYATAPSRFFLIVRGVAVRAKYKIPLPQVISIAGQDAVRVGTGRFRHKNLAPDADLPVYMAMWEQIYTVDKSIESEDILNQIVDTGASMLFA